MRTCPPVGATSDRRYSIRNRRRSAYQVKRTFTKQILPACLCLVIWLSCGLTARADDDGLLYPEDLTWRLITEDEVKQATGCPETLGWEERTAPPLFDKPEIPFADVVVSPDTEPVYLTPPTSWDVAPFPAIAPPPVVDAPSKIRADEALAVTSNTRSGPTAPIFGDIPLKDENVPKAQLRPRSRSMTEQFFAPGAELPQPFSLRRYYTDSNGFFQITAYGGRSSLGAERAYNTLRAAAKNRQTLAGLGQDAFLSVLVLPEALPAHKRRMKERQESLRQAQEAKRERRPADIAQLPAQEEQTFSELPVVGAARPDLLDPGLVKAKSAPSFQDISVNLGLPEHIEDALRIEMGLQSRDTIPTILARSTSPSSPVDATGNMSSPTTRPQAKSGSSLAPRANSSLGAEGDSPAALNSQVPEGEDWGDVPEPSVIGTRLGSNDGTLDEINPFVTPVTLDAKEGGVQVIVMFIPEKRLVCEVAMDKRIGDLPALMRICMLVHQRICTRW